MTWQEPKDYATSSDCSLCSFSLQNLKMSFSCNFAGLGFQGILLVCFVVRSWAMVLLQGAFSQQLCAIQTIVLAPACAIFIHFLTFVSLTCACTFCLAAKSRDTSLSSSILSMNKIPSGFRSNLALPTRQVYVNNPMRQHGVSRQPYHPSLNEKLNDLVDLRIGACDQK